MVHGSARRHVIQWNGGQATEHRDFDTADVPTWDWIPLIEGSFTKTWAVLEYLGYRKFQFGSFTFERDMYFVHIGWPKGKHTIEIDRFLSANHRHHSQPNDAPTVVTQGHR